jgi:pSer/pThr/pTyr-binding forkhead associated (FHA) protein
MDAPSLILEVRLGPRAGRKAVVRPGEALTVGRSPDGGLAIPEDTRLAARHFVVRWDGQKGQHEDHREGGDGTLLNGERRDTG